jgi:hypothetical protein
MAPNFKINNLALFECSVADLQLIAPVAQNVKIVHAPAAPVPPQAPMAVVDSDNYWEDDCDSHCCNGNGMNVAQMDVKQAALARVQARIEARHAAASFRTHALSASGIEETLLQDAKRRSADTESLSSDSSANAYWNEYAAPQHAGLVVEEESVSVDYWTHPAPQCDGETAEKRAQKNAAIKRVEEVMRLLNRMAEYKAAEESELFSAHRVVSQHAPCIAAGGCDSYWVH